jgi:hypothetical protein
MLPFRSLIRCTCVGVLLTSGGLQAEEAFSVKVADAVTYVNVAKVNLTVGKMSFDGGKLLGTYAIQVPLMKSKGENGRIVLPLLQGVEDYARDGGSISGEGIVEGKQDERRRIDVRFSPCDDETQEGRIDLTIDTGARILQFKSTYHLSREGLVVMT